MTARRAAASLLSAAAFVGSCSSDDGETGEVRPAEPTAPTTPDATTVASEPVGSGPDDPSPGRTQPVATLAASTVPETNPPERSALVELVAALASDALGGRDNGSPGAEAARELIVADLDDFAEPFAGGDGWSQPFSSGVNVLGVVPGGDIADEYVIVGAHDDHLGADGCNGRMPDDSVCSGAADNAAGVAAALSVGRAPAAAGPRRSAVLAFWDAEEGGLFGASHYVARPVVSLDHTVAYVNSDILGADLTPALSGSTVVIGAESGGEPLRAAVARASSESALSVAELSLVFGKGRSDHAPFAAAGVPVAFRTDATNGCYHTVDDEIEQLDLDELAEQAVWSVRLVGDLADTDDPPVYDDTAPLVTHDDAVALLALLETGRVDLAVLGQDAFDAFADPIRSVVDAGPDDFGDAAAVVLGAAATLIAVPAAGPCT